MHPIFTYIVGDSKTELDMYLPEILGTVCLRINRTPILNIFHFVRSF